MSTTTGTGKSEGAQMRDSNQPAPASAPVVEEGGADYQPPSGSGEDSETVGIDNTGSGSSEAEGDMLAEDREAAKSDQTGVIGQQELNGLDQNAILDDSRGVQTRGVDNDAYAADRKIDEQVPDLDSQ